MSAMDYPDTAPSFAKSKPLKCFQVEGNDEPEDTMIVFARSSIEAKRHWANEHGDGDKFITGISACRRPQWDSFAPGPVPRLELIDAGWWMECENCCVRISSDYIGTSEPYTDSYSQADWALEREYGPDLTLPVMEPYEPKAGRIWCNKACHDRDMTERARIKRMGARAIAIVAAEVERRWPDVTIKSDANGTYANPANHVSVNRDRKSGYLLVNDVRIGFKCPGMQYGATFAVRDKAWRQSYIVNGRPWEPRDGYTCQTTANRAPLAMRKRSVELWIANGDKDTWDAWRATKREEVTA